LEVVGKSQRSWWCRDPRILALTLLDVAGLSPRAVNCLGRLGIHHRAGARAIPDLAARLQNQRNCGQKTVREILDWAAD
jgi:hypothetical protein